MGELAMIELDGMKFRRDRKTGYFLSNKKVNGRRVRLHRYVYEKHNGTIPDGYDVHHLDHDKSNNGIENLVLLSRGEHMKRHGEEMTEEQIDAKRKNLDINARAKAIEWHKSDAGREWHKLHYESMKDKLYKDYGIRKCEVCGREFIAKTNHQKFCSNNCKSAYRRKTGVDNEMRICPVCGVEFYASKYSQKKYCSRECAGKVRKNKVG